MQPIKQFQGQVPSAMNFPMEAYMAAMSNASKSMLAGSQAMGEGISQGVKAAGEAYGDYKKMESEVKSGLATAKTLYDAMPDGKAKESVAQAIAQIKDNPDVSLRQKFDTINQLKQTAVSLLANQLDFVQKQQLQSQAASSQMAIEKLRSDAAIQRGIVESLLNHLGDSGGLPLSSLAPAMNKLTPENKAMIEPVIQAQQEVKAKRQEQFGSALEQSLVKNEIANKNLVAVSADPNKSPYDIWLAEKTQGDASSELVRAQAMFDSLGLPKHIAQPVLEEGNKTAKEIQAKVPANFADTPVGKSIKDEDSKLQQQWHTNSAFGEEIKTVENLINSGEKVKANQFVLAKLIKTINSLQSPEAVQTSDLNRYITAIPGIQNKSAAMQNLLNSMGSIESPQDFFEKVKDVMRSGDVNATLDLAKSIYNANSSALNNLRSRYSKQGGEWYEKNFGTKYTPFKEMEGAVKFQEPSLGSTNVPTNLAQPQQGAQASPKSNPSAMSATLNAFNQAPAPGNTAWRPVGSPDTSYGTGRKRAISGALRDVNIAEGGSSF